MRGKDGVEGVDVGGAATHDVSGGHLVKIAGGQPLEMRKQAHAQGVENSLGNRRGQVAVQKCHPLDCGACSEVQHGQEQQSVRASDREVAVDDRADDERRRQLEKRGGQDEEGDHHHPRAPGPEEAGHTPHQRMRHRRRQVVDAQHATHRRGPSTASASAMR